MGTGIKTLAGIDENLIKTIFQFILIIRNVLCGKEPRIIRNAFRILRALVFSIREIIGYSPFRDMAP